MQNLFPKDITISRYLITHLIFTILLVFRFSINAGAQSCPPNIDFETGTFANWICYTGTVFANNNQNEIVLTPSGGPINNRHTMYSAAQNNGNDYYGGFPISCPNGSGYSIRLGNDLGGTEAEGISYTFTIPSNRDTYSLVYHYAVVFQDPNHLEFQQPRLELEINNLTDNELINCSSFTFFPNGSLLPGFFISPIQKDTVNVWCKDWTTVSINLNGHAGKTIQLFFKTADCTFRRHFGYAYIDVNSECSSEFVGASFCPDDTTVTVTGPYGYQNYTWFNNNFTQLLGNFQTISLNPPPPSGTTLALEVIPYNGYGCPDTFYARMLDTLTVISNAGPDTISCNLNPVPIGANSIPGLVYQWDPPIGLSNPNIANPRASPAFTQTYVLTTRSLGGGCVSTDTVTVRVTTPDTSLGLTGKERFCITSNDSAVLFVQPGNTVQWFRDNNPLAGSNQISFRVPASGSYYALLTNNDGCTARTAEKNILIETPVPGISYPVQNTVVNYPRQLAARNFGITTLWDPIAFLDDPAIVNPVYNGSTDILYTIQITTDAGCLTVDTQLVRSFKKVNIYVPTAFTPNNDGLNDYLKPIAAGIKALKYFRVYNRWGQLVFDLQSDPKGWDGKINGRPQASQVLVWVTEGIGADDKIYREKGTAVLIR
ncbi:MAG: T9SS type B sorting domain-containing protein [Terrimonas sp.]|nr:T9SS type B sorting domain-containing protein [Terrimonas sp.]